jgi:hypothetical protein
VRRLHIGFEAKSMALPCWLQKWFFSFRRGHWDDDKINCDCSVPKTFYQVG